MTKLDYTKIVLTAADEQGADVFDIDSLEAMMNGGLEVMLRNNEARMRGIDKGLLAWSDVLTKQLFVACPLDSELGAVIAMHELGHVVNTKQGTHQSPEDEAQATEWALLHLPFTISPRTATEILSALLSYAQPIVCDTCVPITETDTPTAWNLEQQLLRLGGDKTEALKHVDAF